MWLALHCAVVMHSTVATVAWISSARTQRSLVTMLERVKTMLEETMLEETMLEETMLEETMLEEEEMKMPTRRTTRMTMRTGRCFPGRQVRGSFVEPSLSTLPRLFLCIIARGWVVLLLIPPDLCSSLHI